MSFDCFLNKNDNVKTSCGPSRGLSGFVRVTECNDTVETHLVSNHLSKEHLSESQLILARAGMFYLHHEDARKMWICYKHRHTLGKFWKSTKVTCHYPEHSGAKKSLKGRDVITLQMAKDIQVLFGVVVAIGSGNCRQYSTFELQFIYCHYCGF